MIKLFSLIFSTFGKFRFNPFPTMMPSNHLLKTNYVFPHEWLVCTFCFSLVGLLIFQGLPSGEPQCTCFIFLKSCCISVLGCAAREAYNTHIALPRNQNMKKVTVFFHSTSWVIQASASDSSFSPYESDRNAEIAPLQWLTGPWGRIPSYR